jgi:hypothetical protein
MTNIRKFMTTGAVAALVGVGALAATSTAVEARTVCNRYGDCWHVSDSYNYPSTLGVRFYGDDWRSRHHWDDRDDWRYHHRHMYWRGDHDGRGYWRNGVWITF